MLLQWKRNKFVDEGNILQYVISINVSVQYDGGVLPDIILAVDPMLLPSGNPFKCHEEVLYFQLLIPPERFDIFPPRLRDAQKV